MVYLFEIHVLRNKNIKRNIKKKQFKMSHQELIKLVNSLDYEAVADYFKQQNIIIYLKQIK